MALLDPAWQTRPRADKGSALHDWVRALEAIAPIGDEPRRILAAAIEEFAHSRPDAPALICERGTLTYRALAGRIRRYARWALAQDLGPGETVCLVMPNRPEYMAIWLGITCAGGTVALINTQLRGASLAHCIDLVAPTHVIAAAECVAALRDAPLSSGAKIWSHGGREALRIDREVERFSAEPLLPGERRKVTLADRALTIFTSGTSGLPKAANVSHRRIMQWSQWFAGLMDIAPDDRMYDCLPMYHAVGGVVATGALLVRGGSVVIREKFSASEFWNDVTDWNCTLFQYIGELARYLVSAPPHPRERQHRLRLACGNGLRAEVWQKFQSRFAIPRILEFYAATEANVSLYNVEGKVGAVGRVPPFLRHRFPLALIKVDAVSGEPIRGTDGRCLRCAAGEVGEAIGKIGTDLPGQAFEGYSEGADTERKILRDAFAGGDAWFRTGDLMRMDGRGYFYFVDRAGDTFRWKGENVAAAEVADALMAFPGIATATVYGVPVPGTEGKAGMAALVAEGAPDLAALRAHLVRRLPAYARPLFLRLTTGLAMTATFKPQTADLRRDGFDLNVVRDPLFFDDAERGAYVPLDRALYERIDAGKLRL